MILNDQLVIWMRKLFDHFQRERFSIVIDLRKPMMRSWIISKVNEK